MTRARASQHGGTSTIDDVARAAGVSTATVSRALRDHRNVAESTRQRVLDAARQLRYVTNTNAARLASGRARAVGLMAPNLGSWYTSEVVAGVEEVLAADGYDLLISTAADQARAQVREGRIPFSQRVDGVLLVDVFCKEAGARQIARWERPTVVLGERLRTLPSITIDNVHGGQLAGEHLVGLGHRRVALVSGHLGYDVPHEVAVDRARGFNDALRAAGVASCDSPHDGDFTIEGGYAATLDLLRGAAPPTGIFLISDEMAFGALHALRDLGLRAGADVSIVGFDGHPVSASAGLSTVGQPVRDLGRAAARALLAEIGGAPRQRRFSPTLELVQRLSSGPAPAVHR